MDWYIRRMTSKDQDSYLIFLSNWIKHVPVTVRYHWLYQENPHGAALTWLAVQAKNENIIGCTSIFPKRMWVRDHIILGAVGGDAFVDPQYRRMGIATELHRVTLKEMSDAGIKLMFGFPNASNFKAFLKIGAFHPGNFKLIRFLLKSDSLIEKIRFNKLTSSVLTKVCNKFLSIYNNFRYFKSIQNDNQLKVISCFDVRFDKLIEEEIPSFNICCIRDSEYLNWRYFKNPLKGNAVLSYEEKGDLLGYAVIEYYGGKCILFDWFIRNREDKIKNFIHALIKFAISKDMNLITLMVNPAHHYTKYFLYNGFKFGYQIQKLRLMVLNNKEQKDEAFNENLINWYLTYGDLDYEVLNY